MEIKSVRSKLTKDEVMKHVSIGYVPLVLLVCLVIAAGCVANRQSSEAYVSQRPFVRNLEDPCDYHPLLIGRPETAGMRSGRVRLAPGKSVGQHSTHAHEELLVFLSGSGIALIGEETRLPVGVGKVAYIPPQTQHDIVNTGTEPLVYVFCVAPAASDH
jgi:mannose-6-phosphate isomerase-like protein (cupin superfamily)